MRVLAALLLTIAFGATAAAEARGAEPATDDVTVMSFNVWLGGDVVDFGKVTEVIEAADADIVGLQEAEGNTRQIAEALGWPYWSDRLHVVSRLPLIDPPEAEGEYLLAQIRPGEVFALANVHLTSDPYGPYAARDGATPDEVLALERETRLPEIETTLAALPDGIPTLLTGDLNTPSHLDWTAARDDIPFPLAWPVTRAIESAGFQDAFRVVHPDPVATPGITWTFGYPFPRLEPNEVVDRIDTVQASAGTEVLSAGIVGPPGTRDADIAVDPYPSDHRAVYATVRLHPAEPAPFASVLHRRVQQGEPVGVRYHAPGGPESDRIAIVPAGGAPADQLMWLPPQEAGYFGSVTFGTGTLAPGQYDALVVTAAERALSRSTFWVVAPGAQPSVAVTSPSAAGSPVQVSWTGAPANRRDWIGIYKTGETDLYNGYLAFEYTGATVAGSVAIELDAETLPPGEYVVRLMRDDGYSVLAEAPLTVTQREA